ncbi:MAG: biopolymer transporter ExbD [Pseudomonadota bacterium]
MLRQMLKRERDEGSIDITPMLDVVFIMLIFFIVTASFIKESGTKVDRPRAYTAQVQDKASVLIAIDAEDRVWVDRQIIDVRGLRAIIERLHAENPKGSVVIQVDKVSRNETLVDVLDAATRAGVRDVAISALER